MENHHDLMGKSSGNHSSTWMGHEARAIIIRVRSRREVMKFIQMNSSWYPIPFYHRLFPAFKTVLSFTYLRYPQMKLALNGSFYGITPQPWWSCSCPPWHRATCAPQLGEAVALLAGKTLISPRKAMKFVGFRGEKRWKDMEKSCKLVEFSNSKWGN